MQQESTHPSSVKKPKWKGRLLATLVLAIGVIGFVGLVKSRPEPPKKPTEDSTPLVEVAPVTAGDVQFYVASQGVVAPLTRTTLSAEVSGAVVDLSDAFLAGGHFGAGDVLMRIDPLNYQVAVERAEAALAQRQIEYDGSVRLNKQGYRSATELSSAKAALASANADLVRAKRDLERTVIRAPYEGLVESRATELGNFVNIGSQLGVIYATDVAEVRLAIPDPDLAFVDLPTAVESGDGPPVTLSGSYRGALSEWDATVVRTEGQVDQRTRMVWAVARVDDPYALTVASEGHTELPMGTFVTAEIAGVSMSNIVKIPRPLLRAGDQVIFVDGERRLRFRNVDVLRTDEDYAYFYGDQLEEQEILLTRLDSPLNGMLVRTSADLESDDSDQQDASSGVGSAAAQ
ncbi:MAG: efflux RND transporter periplasmic adaptor subunit [Pseudomonadota bacterium]